MCRRWQNSGTVTDMPCHLLQTRCTLRLQDAANNQEDNQDYQGKGSVHSKLLRQTVKVTEEESDSIIATSCRAMIARWCEDLHCGSVFNAPQHLPDNVIRQVRQFHATQA
jgi:hypothetical protein